MNQIFTLCLGLDRLYAVVAPIAYRAKNHMKIAQGVAAFSFILGFVDAGTYLLQQYQQSTCNTIVASSASAFTLQSFRIFSNLIVNIVTLIVHVIMYLKLRKMAIDHMSEQIKAHFRQANDTITLILLASLAFVTVPCIMQVCDYFNGYRIFQKYSTILSIGNCINGAVNVAFYAWKHQDFNAAMKKLCSCFARKQKIYPHAQILAVGAGLILTQCPDGSNRFAGARGPDGNSAHLIPTGTVFNRNNVGGQQWTWNGPPDFARKFGKAEGEHSNRRFKCNAAGCQHAPNWQETNTCLSGCDYCNIALGGNPESDACIKYCCPDEWRTYEGSRYRFDSAGCRALGVQQGTDYTATLNNHCKLVYTYAYEDRTSTFECDGSVSLQIMACPEISEFPLH